MDPVELKTEVGVTVPVLHPLGLGVEEPLTVPVPTPALPVMDTDIEMETVLEGSTEMVASEAVTRREALPAPPLLGEVEAVDQPPKPPLMDPLGVGVTLLTPVDETVGEAAPTVPLAPTRDTVAL